MATDNVTGNKAYAKVLTLPMRSSAPPHGGISKQTCTIRTPLPPSGYTKPVLYMACLSTAMVLVGRASDRLGTIEGPGTLCVLLERNRRWGLQGLSCEGRAFPFFEVGFRVARVNFADQFARADCDSDIWGRRTRSRSRSCRATTTREWSLSHVLSHSTYHLPARRRWGADGWGVDVAAHPSVGRFSVTIETYAPI